MGGFTTHRQQPDHTKGDDMNTKKDYEATAGIIADVRAHTLDISDDYKAGRNLALDAVARNLAIHYASDNPKFNRWRFLKVCGVQS